MFHYAHPGTIHDSIVIVAFLALRFPYIAVPVPRVLRLAVLPRLGRSRFAQSFTEVAPPVHCLFVIFIAAFFAGGGCVAYAAICLKQNVEVSKYRAP